MRGFWRGLAIFLLGGILGTGFGVALGFFIFPYVFPPPPAAEQLTEADRLGAAEPVPAAPAPPVIAVAPPAASPATPPASAPATTPSAPAIAASPAPAAPAASPAPAAPRAVAAPVATGTFIHANPNDPVHWGRGRVSVYERIVFLEPDFQVGPGPLYHVYLLPKAGIRSSTDVKGAMYVDLGRLRSFMGSQRYPIPAGVDLSKYSSVVIWCAQFNVLISPADLRRAVVR
jgi:hypothetical protein